MTKLYMLDTNTVSYIIKGVSLAARDRLSNLSPDEAACISAITEAELLYGLARIGFGDRRANAFRAFLARLQVLPWSRAEAATYGIFRSAQEAIGKPLGPLDTQIAAHAITVGAILVSSDTGFQDAVGLPGLESWTTHLPPAIGRKHRRP